MFHQLLNAPGAMHFARSLGGRASHLKKIRLGLVLLICLLAAALLPAMVIGRPKIAPAASHTPLSAICPTATTFDLETDDGWIQTPDGNSLFTWSYKPFGQVDFQYPGPPLCVDEDAVITVNLTNSLPVTTSIIFPGQTGVSPTGSGLFGQLEVGPGGSASYTFTASEPGTYLYESGTEPHKQVQMGLFGALIVRPSLGANFAYNNASTEFDPDREFLLLIHDIDPDLHQAVERGLTYDVTTKHDRYWTINGRSFPDSIAPSGVPWLPYQPYGALVHVEASFTSTLSTTDPALIRYANAGMENHPFHPHGNHLRIIGRDGRLLSASLSASFENFNTTIGSGQTYDLLFRWINVEGWGVGGAPPAISSTVTFPSLLNLVFKDDLTWFSGAPDLGVEDDFPPATTVLNECGEFFFPWHSHALNEFQNFDEGFGGLATLVRVDPPGGCP